MDALFEDKVGCALEELRGDEDNGGCAVADFRVLLPREIDENLASWMLDLQETENCGAVVGDCDVLVQRERLGEIREAETHGNARHVPRYRLPSSCQGQLALVMIAQRSRSPSPR